MTQTSTELVDQITKQSKTNFYFSFLFLPEHKRDAMNTVYSFCRISDDIVDEDAPLSEKEKKLDAWERQLDDCKNGIITTPFFEKFHQVVTDFSIPYSHFTNLIKGMRMDLHQSTYNTFDEMKTYCYHAASTVGLMCIEIFGYTNPQTRRYAEELGLALQFTNILRDVSVDAEIGRYYLPKEAFEKHGYSYEDLNKKIYNPSFISMMQEYTVHAHQLYENARNLLPKEDGKSLLVSEMMHKIYFQILRKIEAKNYNVFPQKIRLSNPRKLQIAFGLYLKSLFK